MRSGKAVLLFIALMGCSAALAVGAGCSTYTAARLHMPPLGVDTLSVWVADLDDGMTGACRQ